MTRLISGRIRAEGVLQADTALYVGGMGGGAVDMPLARDGQHRLYIPGTSLSGALRSWCSTFLRDDISQVWGFQQQDLGRASAIVVDDGLVELPAGANVEIRDGVGIDRTTGSAAEQIKYDRAVLPRGSRISFHMTLELPRDGTRAKAYRHLFGRMLEALRRRSIRLGASKTRGLGVVRHVDINVYEEDYLSRKGLLDILRTGGRRIGEEDLLVGADGEALREVPSLEVEVGWQPDGPLMVKAGHDGITVDMLPLVGSTPDGLALLLPGSSIKGTLRSHAERIVRTLRDLPLSDPAMPPRGFLQQLDVPLVTSLFGTAKREEPAADAPDALPGRGGLLFEDCWGKVPIDSALWDNIALSLNEAELRAALDAVGLQAWRQTFHVGVDRWTGGAAERFLYTVLEPISEWEPMRLQVDFNRLPRHERTPALALLIHLLRDVRSGVIPFGFGVNRGMGAIRTTAVRLRAQNLTSIDEGLAPIDGTELDLDDLPPGVLEVLSGEWQRWISGCPKEEDAREPIVSGHH